MLPASMISCKWPAKVYESQIFQILNLNGIIMLLLLWRR